MIDPVINNSTTQSNRMIKDDILVSSSEIINPGAGGEEYLKSNILENGDFEEDDSYGRPMNFNSWGTSFLDVNSSYQDDVHGGSYSSYVGC